MKMISFEKNNQVGILKFNRPKALNALNRELLNELEEFLTSQIKSEQIRILILTGQGKAFVAGADIKEMQAYDSAGAREFCELGQRVTTLLETLDMITIAAVNGFALGGGLEIALSCDFIYVSNQAKMGLPEVSLGVIPGFGGTQRLSRAVGTPMAKELISTGRGIDAAEALRIGLANATAEPENLMDAALKTAQDILKNSHAAICRAKHSVNDGAGLIIKEALEVEQNYFVDCFNHKDQIEGMAAFVGKRKANFE
ncbi:MAG: 3-hydroxybutyryl-CoA dehydrogenase [Planctomycetes bacterium]|nr:3-hydroxybutyryl-CoA dehydrogenase [Planctomycetota bacterium]